MGWHEKIVRLQFINTRFLCFSSVKILRLIFECIVMGEKRALPIPTIFLVLPLTGLYLIKRKSICDMKDIFTLRKCLKNTDN